MSQQDENKLTKSQQYVLYGTAGALAGACVGALAGILFFDKDLRRKVSDGYENFRDMSYKILDDAEKIREKRNKIKSQKLLED